MPRKLDQDVFYQSPSAFHYNIRLKAGGLINRVTERGFEGFSPKDIEWVWIVEEKRNATSDEIKKLCKAPSPTR